MSKYECVMGVNCSSNLTFESLCLYYWNEGPELLNVQARVQGEEDSRITWHEASTLTWKKCFLLDNLTHHPFKWYKQCLEEPEHGSNLNVHQQVNR